MLAVDSAYGLSPGAPVWECGVKWSVSGKGEGWDVGAAGVGWDGSEGKSAAAVRPSSNQLKRNRAYRQSLVLPARAV